VWIFEDSTFEHEPAEIDDERLRVMGRGEDF